MSLAMATSVERILVRPGSDHHKACKALCDHARRVSNTIQYMMRQSFFAGSQRPSSPEADKIFRRENTALYTAISAASSQRIGQVVDKSWVGYFEALKCWKVNPDSFTGKPRPPKYARSVKTFIVRRNGFRITDGHLYISGGKKIGWLPLKVVCCDDQPFNAKKEKTKVRACRIVPMGTSFMVELVYDRKGRDEELNLDATRVASIDMGVTTLWLLPQTSRISRLFW